MVLFILQMNIKIQEVKDNEQKYVYMFSEGDASMRNLLGGKGANLAEMTKMGLPIPQGFTVTTEACNKYYEDGEVIADEVVEQIKASLAKLEEIAGKKFGDSKNPLLVSVRSGARVSMPGMMDTILNLGLNDISVEGIAESLKIHVLRTTLTEDLSKCSLTLLWKLLNLNSKKFLMK